MKSIIWNGYRVYVNGSVVNTKTSKILTQTIHDHYGYRKVWIIINGKGRFIYTSRLVWIVFKGDIPKGFEIDHIDDNNQNNHLDNLQMLSKEENVRKSHWDKNRCYALKRPNYKLVNN